MLKYLEIWVKQPQSSGWIELLNSFDESVTTEGRGALARLDEDAWPGVVGLDNDDAVWMDLFVPDRNGLGFEKRNVLLRKES